MKKQHVQKPRAGKKALSGPRLWNRLTFVVTAAVMLTYVVTLTYVYLTMNSELSEVMSKTANEKTGFLAIQNAHEVEEYLGLSASGAKSLATQMGGLAGIGLTQAQFDTFCEDTMTRYLEDDSVFGVYMAWEPNAGLIDTPKGLSHYARRDGGRVIFETAYDYDVYSAEEYYSIPYETQKPYLKGPYDYTLSNGNAIWLLTISYPVLNSSGSAVGVLSFDVLADKLNTISFNLGGYSSAYIYTLSNSGVYLSHSQQPERVGSAYGSDAADLHADTVLAATKNGETLQLDGVSAVTGENAYAICMPIHVGDTDQAFSSVFVVDASEVMTGRDATLSRLGTTILLSAIFTFLTITFFVYRLVSPAAKIVKIADGLKRGDLSVKENVKAKNEFGAIYNAIVDVQATLGELMSDTTALTQNALSGTLSYRADPGRHEGAYREIVEGVNATLDAVIEPVTEASGVLVELSKGRLDVSVKGDYRGDHATIKHALNDTIQTLRGYIGELSDRLDSMAGGDFSVSIDAEYRGEFLRLKTSVNTIAESMSLVLAQIRVAADQVLAGTLQVSAGGQTISQGATEQAASIEELTASISAIAVQTRENAGSAIKASELSSGAKTLALEGSRQMTRLQSAMGEINEASADISRIIKVIDEIAFQTNILALNAAVEAARAGAHGKGFAVVAEEVRNLAGKSAEAARETAALIESSVHKAEAGSKIADETAKELQNIVEAVESSAKLVGGIASASGEQAAAIAQVNQGIGQLSNVVQQNSATAEEQAATSEELSGQAEMLKEQTARFSLR